MATKGYIQAMVTVTNIGADPLTAYVVGHADDAGGNAFWGLLGKKILLAGESSQFRVIIFGDYTNPKYWGTGNYTLWINVYDNVINQGTFYSTEGGWTYFEPNYVLSGPAMIAQKNITISVP